MYRPALSYRTHLTLPYAYLVCINNIIYMNTSAHTLKHRQQTTDNYPVQQGTDVAALWYVPGIILLAADVIRYHLVLIGDVKGLSADAHRYTYIYTIMVLNNNESDPKAKDNGTAQFNEYVGVNTEKENWFHTDLLLQYVSSDFNGRT